jgi:hypothetical protein
VQGTGADMRCCSSDAYFTDIGSTADMGKRTAEFKN